MNDIVFQSAKKLARLIRTKKVSATEVMKAHIAQIEKVNPKVNAIVTFLPEAALKEAKKLDAKLARAKSAADFGPLAGLPIAYKDLLSTKGIRTTFGSPVYKDNVPEANSALVERLSAAGAITIGKTNTPEFGAGANTRNAVYGVTANPFDPAKSCAGSSGGSAVALATGMAPICTGSDTGGSLRNPGSAPPPGLFPPTSAASAGPTFPCSAPWRARSPTPRCCWDRSSAMTAATHWRRRCMADRCASPAISRRRRGSICRVCALR